MRAHGHAATTEVTNSKPPTGGVIMPSVRLTITIDRELQRIDADGVRQRRQDRHQDHHARQRLDEDAEQQQQTLTASRKHDRRKLQRRR